MPVDWLQMTSKKATLELTRAKRQWAVVKGLAATVCATLAGIGWTMVDATIHGSALGSIFPEGLTGDGEAVNPRVGP